MIGDSFSNFGAGTHPYLSNEHSLQLLALNDGGYILSNKKSYFIIYNANHSERCKRKVDW